MILGDLSKSLANFEARIGARKAAARGTPRADRGGSRLPADVAEELWRLIDTYERPPMAQVRRDLAAFCRRHGHKRPSRATVYRFLETCPPHRYRISDLPESVRRALYNLDPDSEVPGHQLAQYALQYGDARAMSFAAGLPWLDLYQAARMRGWRPKSRGLLDAITRARKI